MIPEEFFAAVAEVLAFVFRTAGRRRPRRRPGEPAAACKPAENRQIAGTDCGRSTPRCVHGSVRGRLAGDAASTRAHGGR